MNPRKGRMLGIFMTTGGNASLILGAAVEGKEVIFLQVAAILVGTLATIAGVSVFLTYAFSKAERKYLKKVLDL